MGLPVTWCDMVFSGDIGGLMPGAGDDVSDIEWSNYGAGWVINGECRNIKQLLRMIKWRACVGELCEHVAN